MGQYIPNDPTSEKYGMALSTDEYNAQLQSI